MNDSKCPKFIPVDHCNAVDKLLDYVPNILDKIGEICKDKGTTYSYEYYKDNDCECGCTKEEKNENQSEEEEK